MWTYKVNDIVEIQSQGPYGGQVGTVVKVDQENLKVQVDLKPLRIWIRMSSIKHLGYSDPAKSPKPESKFTVNEVVQWKDEQYKITSREFHSIDGWRYYMSSDVAWYNVLESDLVKVDGQTKFKMDEKVYCNGNYYRVVGFYKEYGEQFYRLEHPTDGRVGFSRESEIEKIPQPHIYKQGDPVMISQDHPWAANWVGNLQLREPAQDAWTVQWSYGGISVIETVWLRPLGSPRTSDTEVGTQVAPMLLASSRERLAAYNWFLVE